MTVNAVLFTCVRFYLNCVSINWLKITLETDSDQFDNTGFEDTPSHKEKACMLPYL